MEILKLQATLVEVRPYFHYKKSLKHPNAPRIPARKLNIVA
jgi:hypothetical protein